MPRLCFLTPACHPLMKVESLFYLLLPILNLLSITWLVEEHADDQGLNHLDCPVPQLQSTGYLWICSLHFTLCPAGPGLRANLFFLRELFKDRGSKAYLSKWFKTLIHLSIKNGKHYFIYKICILYGHKHMHTLYIHVFQISVILYTHCIYED